MSGDPRIELTLYLWATSSDRFEEYLAELVALLPRHRSHLARRIDPLDGRSSDPDAVLVMSFPNALAIDSFLRDPAHAELEELGNAAVARSLISDGRKRIEPIKPATLHQLHHHDQ